MAGCGVVGPLGFAGRRDAGLGVIRAPGSGVARGMLAARASGGEYQAAAIAASRGHPFGSHGISALVVS